MSNPTHPTIELSTQEEALVKLARRVAEDSPDRSRKVGVVIVNDEGKIITTGCNTLPLGVEHTDEYLERPAKYDWTEHAERNALYEAAREGRATKGCCIVLPWFPCLECARAIVQSGITRVVAQYPDVDDPTWGPGFKVGLKLFEKAGIQFDAYVDDEPMPQARAEGDHAVCVVDPDRPGVDQLVQAWNEAIDARPRPSRGSRP